MKKRVAVLGATGSIGKSALDVLRGGKDFFQPVLFSSHQNSLELAALKKEFPGARTALTSAELPCPAGIDFSGSRGLLDAIAAVGADITVNAISGSAGLLPSFAVLDSGGDLALANKETAVMAGPLVFARAAEKNARIIPVDSEHSAIFKLICAHGKDNIRQIILTASGGPFRGYQAQALRSVTVEQALAHPTWNMGPKITIDSATLANKGLEVMEAVFFFGLQPESVTVVIHPQSVVHSMIRLKDGAVYAQMSNPDMRLPIHDALWWPQTAYSPFGALDFDSLTLNFEKCDPRAFPMIALAYRALEKGPLYPAVYNAANEAAVEAFFKGRIGFLDISRVVGYVIDKTRADEPLTIENVLERDRKARTLAEEFITNTGSDGSLRC
ncbi:MAG: 1-deoxy-D-xylulose-5-phosphate reductoisomerase [Treponema sp.]|nr:1-deoxy-D-xylulose-5-phosphate reductoisomerase [Treponema sp.]